MGVKNKYVDKASEAPASVLVSLNRNFGIIFECSNGKIMNIKRERESSEGRITNDNSYSVQNRVSA